MSIYSAVTLDVSRFPKPMALSVLDYEAIMAERLPRLVALFNEFGVAFDVEMLETDPAVIVQQADAYRELLLVARINDAVRAVMILFAQGTDLDNLGVFYRTFRRTLVPASGATPAVMEGDDEFRRRILLAPEAFTTGGAAGAYVYHALTSDPDVLNVDVWTPFEGSGQVIIAVQSRYGDGTASDDLVERVHAHIHRLGPNGWQNIKPLTTVVSTRSIVNFPYQIVAQGFVLPGPDPVETRTLALASLTEMAARRRTPARDVPLSAIHAAGMVGAMDRLTVVSPTAHIARGHGEVALCTGIELTVSTHDG